MIIIVLWRHGNQVQLILTRRFTSMPNESLISLALLSKKYQFCWSHTCDSLFKIIRILWSIGCVSCIKIGEFTTYHHLQKKKRSIKVHCMYTLIFMFHSFNSQGLVCLKSSYIYMKSNWHCVHIFMNLFLLCESAVFIFGKMCTRSSSS